jgi:hypothetical protein
MLQTLFLVTVLSAPGPRADEIAGDLCRPLSECPAIRVYTRQEDGSFTSVEYWLVFTSQEIEQQAAKIETGVSAKATGKVANGGRFAYLIVSSLSAVK